MVKYFQNSANSNHRELTTTVKYFSNAMNVKLKDHHKQQSKLFYISYLIAPYQIEYILSLAMMMMMMLTRTTIAKGGL